MSQASSEQKKVVIIGGGFAGIYGALSVYRELGGDVSITIINRTNYFLFTPMLHEVATGSLGQNQVAESVRQIIAGKRISFVETEACSVDLAAKQVLSSGTPIPYDMLVVAVGATTNYFNTPGAMEHAHSLKNLADAIALRAKIIDQFEAAAKEPDAQRREEMLSFVIVGGGATGVETAAEIADFCHNTLSKQYACNFKDMDISVTLVNAGPDLLSVFPATIRAYAKRTLEKQGVRVMNGTQVKEVTPNEVVLGDGICLPAGTVVWAAGVKANSIDTTGGELPKDGGGRIKTDANFRVQGFTDVFAVGDCTNVAEASGRGLPMLAQVAEKEGKLLGTNIALALAGKPLEQFVFKPQGQLVSLGRWKAAGTVFGINIYGKFAWYVWRTVYLFKFISGSKRLRIAFDWTLQLFYPRDVTKG